MAWSSWFQNEVFFLGYLLNSLNFHLALNWAKIAFSQYKYCDCHTNSLIVHFSHYVLTHVSAQSHFVFRESLVKSPVLLSACWAQCAGVIMDSLKLDSLWDPYTNVPIVASSPEEWRYFGFKCQSVNFCTCFIHQWVCRGLLEPVPAVNGREVCPPWIGRLSIAGRT